MAEVRFAGVKFRDVAFSPDGEHIAAIAKNRLCLWTRAAFMASTPPLVRDAKDVDAHNSIAYSPDGQSIALAGMDGAVRIVDAASGEPVRTVHPHGESANQAVFSPNGERLAVASADRTVSVGPLDFETLYSQAKRMRAAGASAKDGRN